MAERTGSSHAFTRVALANGPCLSLPWCVGCPSCLRGIYFACLSPPGTAVTHVRDTAAPRQAITHRSPTSACAAVCRRGTGFKEHHRERLGLRGLLPPCETTLETQMARLMNVFRNGISTPPPPEPITEQHIQQWLLLR